MIGLKSARGGYAVGFWLVLMILISMIGWFMGVAGLILPDSFLSVTLESAILILVIILTCRVFFRSIKKEYSRGRLVLIGLIWSLLFITNDVLYGFYVMGLSLDTTMSHYNILTGHLEVIVLLVVFLSPNILGRVIEDDPDPTSVPMGKMLTIGLLPSRMKIAYYRRRGADIGDGVSIGLLSILECDKITIGDHAEIGMACVIRAHEFQLGRYSRLGMAVIIDTHRVLIGEEVTIQEQTFIGGLKTDKSLIEIGDLSMIFSGSVLNPTYPIKIGKRVGIGGSNYLFTHGTWQPILNGFPVSFGPITIEDGVWFPWRVFVLPNVHIGREATIGACALINRDVPARCLAAGVPAEVVRRNEEYIKTYSHSEKRQILWEMLVELVGYLRIEKWKCEDPTLYDAHAFTTFLTPKGPSSKKQNHVIFMFEDKPDAWTMVQDRTFVISLFPLGSNKVSELEAQGCWWFDLENNKWGGTRTNVSLTIRGWLSRYGHWLKYTS